MQGHFGMRSFLSLLTIMQGLPGHICAKSQVCLAQVVLWNLFSYAGAKPSVDALFSLLQPNSEIHWYTFGNQFVQECPHGFAIGFNKYNQIQILLKSPQILMQTGPGGDWKSPRFLCLFPPTWHSTLSAYCSSLQTSLQVLQYPLFSWNNQPTLSLAASPLPLTGSCASNQAQRKHLNTQPLCLASLALLRAGTNHATQPR